MTTEDKLKIIHSYGDTHSWSTHRNTIGMIIISRTDDIPGFGSSLNNATDALYESLKTDMLFTVRDIDERRR